MAETENPRKPSKKTHQDQNLQSQKPTEKPPPWAVVRSLFTCKHLQPVEQQAVEGNGKKHKKMKCSGSLCNNTKVMQRPESSSPEDCKKWASICSSTTTASSRSLKVPLNEINGAVPTPSSSSSSSSSLLSSGSSVGGSFRSMPLRRLSGCYECRAVVDPISGVPKDPALRTTACSCPECGEIFTKAENLEAHQAVRHAVSELGPEDTSRNIVEIIFQSSWLKKQASVCKVDRILKVHNSQKTITRFEDYRESIKAKASKLAKKHPRCVADGNELLRFHCTTFVCSIGMNGSSNLCNSIPQCNVCSIIRNGFKIPAGDAGSAICTTATSGKAHDNAQIKTDDDKRAMLVCRVIAGRVKRTQDTNSEEIMNQKNSEEFDSVAGPTGIYSNLDELYVFNPKAILPCFVVIYRGF
ncbi:PREDICTED: uncharacterized protein LOC104608536 [Nelumbo nucifera]|uniref:Uncharacterized protein LOC104608536 n=2 Tax=Nelumbo nucifera TaxID=4432 RepID=A0A1U8B9X5_NELNU|nr:PREDICTED: uncharacterized protein LOC104608536 [Nelumbo nucifera]DAD39547.1 TPA_asm: hypothetical protein HUJ06_013870 [Nelumbo nucifera]